MYFIIWISSFQFLAHNGICFKRDNPVRLVQANGFDALSVVRTDIQPDAIRIVMYEP
jgi:hypothetical protein